MLNKYPISFTQKFKTKAEYEAYLYYIISDGRIFMNNKEIGKMVTYFSWYDNKERMFEIRVDGYTTGNLFENPNIVTYSIEQKE